MRVRLGRAFVVSQENVMSTPPPDQPIPVSPQPAPRPAPQAVIPGSRVAYHEHPAPRRNFLLRVWAALKSITLLVSMFVNLILIVVVVVLINQVGAIKMTLASILGQLDSAFQGLGAATIVDTIKIDQQVPVRFDLPLSQDTTVVTQAPVPITAYATFSLGQFGSINGTVSLALPTGTALPVHLELTVPVSNSIPVVFDQPVSIPLAERGLAPVVAKLRSALGPLINLVKQLPDAFIIIP
jgi:hypothetical protein